MPVVFPWFIQTWLEIRDHGFRRRGPSVDAYLWSAGRQLGVCIPVDVLASWTGMSCHALDVALAACTCAAPSPEAVRISPFSGWVRG